MAQGCISVIEMTVMLGFVQQNPRRGVMAKGKKLPRFDVSKAGQGFCVIGSSGHAASVFIYWGAGVSALAMGVTDSSICLVWLLTSEGQRTIQDGAD